MVKRERPTARLRVVSREDARAERVLRAGTGVDGDAGSDQLREAADEVLQHRRNSDDEVPDGEHGGAFEKIGEEAVDHLQALADEARQRRDKAESDEPEAELSHHHRKNYRGDAVLQVVQNMTTADQAERHALLPQCGFEGRRVGGYNSRRNG